MSNLSNTGKHTQCDLPIELYNTNMKSSFSCADVVKKTCEAGAILGSEL